MAPYVGQVLILLIPQKRSRNAPETARKRPPCILRVGTQIRREGSALPSDKAQIKSGMDSLEATSHPFVIRIWLEERAQEAHGATWRGHITHVPSGERRYLQSLDDMASFVAPYLESMGIKPSLWWRVRQGLKRLK